MKSDQSLLRVNLPAFERLHFPREWLDWAAFAQLDNKIIKAAETDIQNWHVLVGVAGRDDAANVPTFASVFAELFERHFDRDKRRCGFVAHETPKVRIAEKQSDESAVTRRTLLL